MYAEIVANPPSVDVTVIEGRLLRLLEDLRQTDAKESWDEVATTSHSLANVLRVKDGPVDNHTLLGRTALPQTCTSLFRLALHDAPTPSEEYVPAVYEILRVCANICMDHDENRGYMLEAGLPQALVALLEGYADTIISPLHNIPLKIPVSQLRIVKVAIGVLLNSSVSYDPVKYRLISLEAALTILKLSLSIYPPGSWLTAPLLSGSREANAVIVEENWALRSSLSDWSWKIITELKDINDESLQIFSSSALPFLVLPLQTYCSPYSEGTNSPFGSDHQLTNTLIHADFEVLEECCMLIESLSLDSEDIRLSLAQGYTSPVECGDLPYLTPILDFIEYGKYPQMWRLAMLGDAERKRMQKAFDICKAALIKSVVEVAGEERNLVVLWDDKDKSKPGGEFVARMVNWIKNYVTDMEEGPSSPEQGKIPTGRDDLVICASLALGNIIRNEKISEALLSPPYSLSSTLASDHLLSGTVDVKVRHGIIGLLKHIAQSAPRSVTVRAALLDAGIVRIISDSGLWDERNDPMGEVVQLGAIGVVKHLCGSSIDQTIVLVLPSSKAPSSPTGLMKILALVKRSDSVPVKSEGTRVVVNAIKSLWSVDPSTTPPSNSAAMAAQADNAKDKLLFPDRQQKRIAATRSVLTYECALALAAMVARSAKYPVLVNEGIVSMSLLSTHRDGGPLVLRALMAPVDSSLSSNLTEAFSETSGNEPQLSPTSVDSTPSSPRHALDMLVQVLRNVDNPVNFPVEIRANACSLLLQLERHNSQNQLAELKAFMHPVLEELIAESTANDPPLEDMLAKAIKKILDAWSLK